MNPRNVHELMKAFPRVDAHIRDWCVLLERDGTIRTAELFHLIDSYIGKDYLLVWQSRKIADYLPRNEAILFVVEHIGKGDIKITDRQFNGFVVVASNGVGTGWPASPIDSM